MDLNDVFAIKRFQVARFHKLCAIDLKVKRKGICMIHDFALLRGYRLRLHNHKRKMNGESIERRDHDDKQVHTRCNNLYRKQDCKCDLYGIRGLIRKRQVTTIMRLRKKNNNTVQKHKCKHKHKHTHILTMIPMLSMEPTFLSERA